MSEKLSNKIIEEIRIREKGSFNFLISKKEWREEKEKILYDFTKKLDVCKRTLRNFDFFITDMPSDHANFLRLIHELGFYIERADFSKNVALLSVKKNNEISEAYKMLLNFKKELSVFRHETALEIVSECKSVLERINNSEFEYKLYIKFTGNKDPKFEIFVNSKVVPNNDFEIYVIKNFFISKGLIYDKAENGKWSFKIEN